MKTINDINLNNKIVLINADLNVGVDNKPILNKKINNLIETINYALNQNTKIIVTSHIENNKDSSLKPIAQALCDSLAKKVYFNKYNYGIALNYALEKLNFGEVLFLEMQKDENNDEAFAKYWIEHADVFINDDLETITKQDEAIKLIAKNINSVGIGINLSKQIKVLDSFKNCSYTKPLVVIMGGNFSYNKMLAIKQILCQNIKVLIAGNLAATFLKAKSIDTGNSYVNLNYLEEIKELFRKYNSNIILPIDFYCYRDEETINNPVLLLNKINDGYSFLDIGKSTLESFVNEIKQAKTIIWDNMLSTKKEAPAGTYQLAKILNAFSEINLIGLSDELLEAINHLNLNSRYMLLSTESNAFWYYFNDCDSELLEIMDKK